MIKFLKYLWKNYRKEQKILALVQKSEDMIGDLKNLTRKDFIIRYGAPQRAFTLIKWELHKVRNNIVDCELCKRYHQEGKCKQ